MQENYFAKNKILLAILLIVISALAGAYYWSTRTSAPAANYLPTDTDGINTSGVTEAVKNIPTVNPYANTNPFKNIKTNPFK